MCCRSQDQCLHQHTYSSMSKKSIADLIIDDRVIGISVKYLDEYIYGATSSYNGFRQDALRKILESLPLKVEDKEDIWAYVNENKKGIKYLYSSKCVNGVLWLKDSKKANMALESIHEYFIVFEWNTVNKPLDDTFYEILEQELDKNSELKDIILINS